MKVAGLSLSWDVPGSAGVVSVLRVSYCCCCCWCVCVCVCVHVCAHAWCVHARRGQGLKLNFPCLYLAECVPHVWVLAGGIQSTGAGGTGGRDPPAKPRACVTAVKVLSPISHHSSWLLPKGAIWFNQSCELSSLCPNGQETGLALERQRRPFFVTWVP